MKNMKMIYKYLIFVLVLFLILFFTYLFIGKAKPQEVKWGVAFSSKHAKQLGLDWKKVYNAILEDLNVKNVRIITHWDLLEPKKDKYDFSRIDWQIEKAKEKNAKVILNIGMKTARWPECHLPGWVRGKNQKEQQKEVRELLTKITERYKNEETIKAWQVENEPFFVFGDCPWYDREFLEEEIALVKEIDQKDRPVVISESGEWSFWTKSARLGDIVGTTLYKKVWFSEFNRYYTSPLTPIFYKRRADFINKFFKKDVICIEMQAEPWGPRLLYDVSLEEQEKTMNPKQFEKMVSFAKKAGLKEYYFWGAEWWYWMKEVHNQPQIWNRAKELIKD